jgi:hypothetical protein
MEIKIGIGLDNLIFGMSQDEVKSILGMADKITETEKEEGIVCYFNKLLIKTKFDKNEDCRMYSIEVFNPEAIMFGQKIIDADMQKILKILESNDCEKIEREDYDTFETIFCEEIWSTFLFEFDRLRSVEFSPLFGDDDKIIWPSITTNTSG